MTSYLTRPEGRLAYDDEGDGPLVVLVPGLGDLRSTYRHLVPQLVAAGFRTLTVDLRGHGDSDTGFASYGDVETADDLVALLDELGGPAIVVGNSMAGGSAALVAATRPDLVLGLVLVGPFVRDATVALPMRMLMRVALSRPFVRMTWRSYLPGLYAGRRPDDHERHLDDIAASLRRPGYAAALSATTRTTHQPVEDRLGEVTAPTLVVMGTLDPDFADPAAEADWIAGQTRGTVVMVPEAGHYPHAQRPDLVGPAVISFARESCFRA